MSAELFTRHWPVVGSVTFSVFFAIVIHYGSTGVALRLSFEWDEEKAKENYRKHEVSFEEGSTVLSDPFSITIDDPDHSADERRYIDIGCSEKGRILVVSYTERNRGIRIISCRKATRLERRRYAEGIN